MRRAVHDMTKAVSITGDVEVSRKSMYTCIFPIQRSCMHTEALYTSTSTLPLPPEGALGSWPALTLFIVEFAALLSALVPQLDKRSSRLSSVIACSVGTPEEHVFWELWGCLETCSAAFCVVSSKSLAVWEVVAGSEEGLPFHHPLCNAVHCLLSWLLSFTRTPAWRLMRTEHSVYMRNEQLLQILTMPLEFLFKLCKGPHSSHVTQFNLLPPNFVPLLCCISAELHSNVPFIVPRPKLTKGMRPATYSQGVVWQAKDASPLRLQHFTRGLSDLLSCLSQVDISPSQVACFPFLTSPAVVQMLKVALIVQTGMQPSAPDSLRQSVLGLGYILGLQQSMGCHVGALSISDQAGNRDAAGLPLHLNPVLSDQALETDRRLLHALTLYMDADVLSTVPCCLLQASLVQSWEDTRISMRDPVPPAVLVKMAESIVGLAKQCTTHGLYLIQHVMAERGSNQIQKRARTSSQKQQRNKAQAEAAQRRGIKFEFRNKEGMEALRNMMLLITSFQTHLFTKRFSSHSSKLRRLKSIHGSGCFELCHDLLVDSNNRLSSFYVAL